ncbi:MAG: alkaline phosphatase D family protein [Opitutaceae bacterium]
MKRPPNANSRRLIAVLAATQILLLGTFAQTEGEQGMSAPPEAYEPGNPFPYFGSENPWNRRMFGEQPAELFYKRRGQRQILATLEGHPEDAAQWCRERLAIDPTDQESWFNLVVALGQLGQTDEMIAALRGALNCGLPFARFIAGPRDLLAPLYAHPEFIGLKREMGIQLVHGPMLGAMTPHSVQIWVRTANPARVRVDAVPLSRRGDAVSTTFETTDPQDQSGVGILTGLEAATVYHYRVFVDGLEASFPGEGTFRTAPETGTRGSLTVAFGGCAGYTPVFEPVWDTILERRPDALLLLGDNVYLDLPETPGAFHRYTYFRRQSRPEFRRLVSSVSTYAIWDDHDAGMDDLWLGPYPDRPDWKLPNLEFFKRNWNNPASGDSAFPGVWFRFTIGDVEFFMLDGRSYRTNPYAPERTMLGPVQKAWLLDALAGSTATFKVLASPVAWSDLSKEGSFDTWSGFKAERDEIFDFIHERGISGIVLISSDRHRSDAWVIDRPLGYRFYEFGSGKLTNIHTHEPIPEAIFSYSDKNTFGLLRFDTTLEDPTVTNEFWTIDGEKIFTSSVPLSALQDQAGTDSNQP